MPDFPELIGQSAAVASLRTSIARLLARLQGSPRPPSVLLLGETGTGKGLVARILHDHGPRSSGPFVDVNCAAIPDTLLEAELFGFERGAFTDARQAKAGLFQTANRGVIFLDEIALMPEPLQAKLLKVLEERTVRRLGATRSEPTDFWLVAATNADLAATVAERRFRADLHQRLAVVRFVLPPLRVRDSDILLLAEHFLARAAADYGLARRVLTEDARQALLTYAWPGNIRELANVMERVSLLTEGDRITAAALDLPADASERADAPRRPIRPRTLQDAVHAHLLHVLEEHEGNISRAAVALGVSRNTLRARLRAHGIPLEGRRGRPRGPAVVPAKPPSALVPPEPLRIDAGAPEATIRWETRLVTFLRATLHPPETWPGDGGRVLSIMIEKIQNFGGRLEELSTSSAGAMFGVALTDDSCRLAVQAGLSMIKAVERDLGVPEGASPLRVSVHTTRALVGRVGAEIQLDRTDRASILGVLDRLGANTDTGTVVVSAITATFLERRFHLRAAGELAPHAWVVVGHEKRGLEALRRPTPMIGRDDELALLAARWRTAQEGRGQLVLLVGEAGLGKSRLLWEFRTSDHLRDGHVFEVQGNPAGGATSYGPFLELFRQYFQVEPDDDAQRLRDKVVGKLALLTPEASQCAVAILAFLGLEPEDPGWMDLDNQQRARRILDGLRQIILSEVQSRPVLIVIEDLHWLDPASRALVDALVDGLAALPLMLVATCRPPVPHDWLSPSYFTPLSLSPLIREQMAEILARLLGDDAGLAPLRERLLDRVGGNPFVVEESVRALVDTGVLEGSPGSYGVKDTPTQLPLPPTVEELLAARFGRLSASLQQIVDVAAVVGREVPRSVLAGVLGRPRPALQDELVQLRRMEILSEAGPGDDPLLRFHHPILQEVAYSRLPDDQRRRLHARAYEALGGSESPGLADETERLARHAFRGGLWPDAVRLFAEAAQKAELRGSSAETAAHLEMALSALERLPESRDTLEQAIDLRLALRSTLTELGAHDRVFQHLETAEALAHRLGDNRRLGRASAFISDYYRLVVGDSERARSYSQRAFTFGQESGDLRVQVVASTYLGMVLYGEGDYAAAAARFQSNIDSLIGAVALERLGTAGLPAVHSRTWLGLCLSELGEFDRAVRLGTEATELAEAVPQPVNVATAAAGLGRVLLRRGRVDAAVPILSRGLDVCRAHGVALWLPNLASALGLALARTDRIDEGLALLEEGIRQAASSRNLVGHSQRLCALGQGYLAAGRLEDARRVADEALETAARSEQRGNMAWAHWLRGEVERAAGTHDVAADHYRRATQGAKALGMRPLSALAELGLAESLRAIGDEGAAGAIDRARAVLTDLGMSYLAG